MVRVLRAGGTFVVLLLVWELLARLAVVPAQYLPPVERVALALVHLVGGQETWNAEVLTILRALAGFAISATLGLALALLGALWPWLRRAMGPLVELLRPVPPAALVPICLFAMGTGPGLYLLVVVMVAIWPTYLSAVTALAGVNEVLVQTGRSFGCRGPALIWQVVLPHALPDIFTGLRISAAISLVAVVVTEMLTERNGIGALLFHMAFALRVPDVFALTLICGLNGLAFAGMVDVARKWLAAWSLRLTAEAGA